jgi:hypothetical protein
MNIKIDKGADVIRLPKSELKIISALPAPRYIVYTFNFQI